MRGENLGELVGPGVTEDLRKGVELLPDHRFLEFSDRREVPVDRSYSHIGRASHGIERGALARADQGASCLDDLKPRASDVTPDRVHCPHGTRINDFRIKYPSG